VVHSNDWLGLNIFPPAEDALPRTRRHLNTWKTGCAIKVSQCSGHLYWIKPQLQTFWSNCAGTHCWLALSEHLITHETWATKKQKAPQHLKNRFCLQGQSMFWPFILNQTSPDWLHGWNGILENQSGLNATAVGSESVYSFVVWFSINRQNIDLPSRRNRFSRWWNLLVLGRASSACGKVFRSSQSSMCTTAVGSERMYLWFDSL